MQIDGVNCVPGGTVTTLANGAIQKARLRFSPLKATQFTPTIPFYKNLSLNYNSSKNIYFLGGPGMVIGPIRDDYSRPYSGVRCVENSTGTFFYDEIFSWTPSTQSGDIITVEFSTLMNSMVFPDYQLITDVQVVVENGVKKFALTKETIAFNKVL